MNRRWVRWHLTEALEALEKTIQELDDDPEFDDAVYWVDMQHLYHHLNTAWNARNATEAEVEPGTDADFNRWSKFPNDLPMMEVS
jgi:hypothetical protein